jgi:O-antigen ligase
VASGVEINYLNPIEWLPQSCDKGRTLRAFWKYLAIVLSFAAARDWLMGASRRERQSDDGTTRFPGDRMQWLLWMLGINAAAVSLVGMLQRLDGTDRLLWSFTNHLNGGNGAFGPFPYRSSGAQYLNLMWPVTLGFWWVLRRRNVARRSASHRSGGDPHVLLLVLAGLTAAGVVVANSRGGFLVLVGLLVAVLALMMLWSKRQLGFKLGLVVSIVAVLGVGGWLGGEAMMVRFRSDDFGTLNGRKPIYEDSARMAEDFAVFGSGAETFAPLYYFYRKKDPAWNAYVHDDYLETRITFGTVGFVIILMIFLTVWLVPFFGNGIPSPPEFFLLIGVAMVGILAHAKFDLPFQIYSIHSQFVLLCAVLTTLKWQRG